MDPVVNDAPVAAVILGDGDEILELNEAARCMGFQAGQPMALYAGLEEPFIEHLRHQPGSFVYRFVFDDGEKRCRAVARALPAGQLVWLPDMSEQLALGEQIRKLRQPGISQLRQVNQLAIAAMGYAELLDVVMTDSDTLSNDRLARVRHYQSEVYRNLRAIQRVISGESLGNHRGTVLVADRHSALTDLIAELLRSEGYRVVGFSDAESTIKYCQVNGHTLQKAVIDELLLDASSVPLIQTLRAKAPTLDIVVLCEEGADAGQGRVPKPLDFRVLLEAVADSDPGE